jgi:hypothetical protein
MVTKVVATTVTEGHAFTPAAYRSARKETVVLVAATPPPRLFVVPYNVINRRIASI